MYRSSACTLKVSAISLASLAAATICMPLNQPSPSMNKVRVKARERGIRYLAAGNRRTSEYRLLSSLCLSIQLFHLVSLRAKIGRHGRKSARKQPQPTRGWGPLRFKWSKSALELHTGRPGALISERGATHVLMQHFQQRLQSSDKERYDRFLAVFSKYRESLASADSAEAKNEHLDTMKAEAKTLLAGHDDLISEFDALTTM